MSDGCRPSDTLEELVRCAGSWDADARLLGNLRAADIVSAVSEALRITRELGGYSYSLWDEDFRDGYRKVNSGLIVDASKFNGGRDG